MTSGDPREVDRRSTGRDAGGPGARQIGTLRLVSVGTFMTTLDTSIVNIALPSIAHSFGTPIRGWMALLGALASLPPPPPRRTVEASPAEAVG
jgi:hypothetical protein